MIENQDILLTMAQVGATFAGFAAVVGAFRNSSRNKWIIRDVVEISVIAALISFLPFIVHTLDFIDDPWRATVLLCAVLTSIGWGTSLMRHWTVWKATMQVLLPVGTMSIFSIMLAWLVGLNLVNLPPTDAFLILAFLLLASAGYMFIYLLTEGNDN